MKAFVVTILVPDTWQRTDLLSACNKGIAQHVPSDNHRIGAMEYNVMVREEFRLKEPKL